MGEDLIGQQLQTGAAFVDRQPADERIHNDFASTATDLIDQRLRRANSVPLINCLTERSVAS